MSRLITTSLVGGIKWYKDSPPHWKSRARESLKGILARVWTEPTGYAKKGIEFEKMIYSILGTKTDIEKIDCSAHFRNILRLCKDGIFQKKIKKMITVDDKEYCLYGKEDVSFPYQIYDIKTCKVGSFSEDKYLKSFQHVLYMYVDQKVHFKYIVAVFEDDVSSSKILSVRQLDIVKTIDFVKEQYKQQIIDTIREIELFFNNHPDLKELYENKYSLY